MHAGRRLMRLVVLNHDIYVLSPCVSSVFPYLISELEPSLFRNECISVVNLMEVTTAMPCSQGNEPQHDLCDFTDQDICSTALLTLHGPRLCSKLVPLNLGVLNTFIEDEASSARVGGSTCRPCQIGAGKLAPDDQHQHSRQH